MSDRFIDTLVADVAVIGAGPAGIAAATRIAERGKRVVLLDQSPAVGGQIWRHRPGRLPPAAARSWMTRLERSGTTIATGSAVVDASDGNGTHGFVVTAEQGTRVFLVESTTVVLATGARELFLPFPGWTLPGVMGVGAAQALLKSGLSFADRRVVIAGSGPLLLAVASALADDGAEIALVAEQAPARALARFAAGLWRTPATLLQAARYRASFARTPYLPGTWVTAARGDDRLQEVSISDGVHGRTIPCDILCTAQGLVPNTELARLLGCATTGPAVSVDERQETSRASVYCVGESTGIGGVDLAVVEGEIAGLHAARRDADARRLYGRRARLRATADAMKRAFAPRSELRALATPDTILCRCEDVRLGAISPSWTVRQTKLYTRAGMGPCQGRVCGAALDFLFGWPADTVRVPSQPALLSTILAKPAVDAAKPLHHGVFE